MEHCFICHSQVILDERIVTDFEAILPFNVVLLIKLLAVAVR